MARAAWERILRVLAEGGAMSIYAVKKKVGVSYSSCFAGMKLLEARGLILLKEVSSSSKGGVMKVYSLTFEGLLEAVRAGWTGRGAENLADLDPIVFGKWRRISEAVPEGEAAAALVHAARAAYGLRGEEAARAFREAFYTIPLTRGGFSWDAWVKAIKGDGELRRAVAGILREAYAREASYLRSIEEAIRVLEAD